MNRIKYYKTVNSFKKSAIEYKSINSFFKNNWFPNGLFLGNIQNEKYINLEDEQVCDRIFLYPQYLYLFKNCKINII